MIHLRLAGGLGNQLFQICAALALRRDGDEQIRLSLHGLGQYKARRAPDSLKLLDLQRLGINAGPLGPLTRALIESARIGRFIPHIGINDRNFVDALRRRDIGSVCPARVLDGYFQVPWDWPLFSPLLQKLHGSLVSAPSPVATLDCAMHVRGGDFIRNPLHDIVDHRFYSEAINHLERLVGAVPLRKVQIITDDPPHARVLAEQLARTHPHITFSMHQGNPDPLDDFRHIAGARYRIIGNSTFSWWASALDPSRAPTVSPAVFVRGQPRHLALPWETVLPVPTRSA